MKKCTKCGIEKERSEYYAHPETLDKTTSQCKECIRKAVKNRLERLKHDPAFIEKERARGRDKFRRLKYKNSGNKKSSKKHLDKYPEKRVAKNLSQHIKVDDGFSMHHWSYQLIHVKDIIPVETHLHMFYHRFLKYDTEHFMYRCVSAFDWFPAGMLLDTREIHVRYLEYCKNTFEK